MSIVKMRKMVRKQIKLRLFGRTFELGSPMAIIFWLIVIIFLVGTYFMYGPGGGGGGPAAARGGGERTVSAVIATVDGERLARNAYERRLYSYQRQQQAGVTDMAGLKLDLLNGMIDTHLMREAARAEGIEVTSGDLKQRKTEIVEELLARRYPDRKDLQEVLRERDISLDAFKDELRREWLPDDDQLRQEIMFDKLQEQVRSSVEVTDEELRQSFAEVNARHILIDPHRLMEEATSDEPEEAASDAGNETDEGDEANADGAEIEDGSTQEDAETEEPADAGDAEPEMTPAQAKQKARERLLELKQRAESGADFAELAKEHSESPFSAEQGGDMGWFKRTRPPMELSWAGGAPEFMQTAFSLEKGEISEPVETPLGLHIIKLEDRRLELPEDFEENKERYRQSELLRQQQQAWQDYQQQLRDAAEIEIVDPELKAYKLLEEDAMGNTAQAAQLLAQAVENDPTSGAARYMLAMLLRQADRTPDAIKVLSELAESEMGKRSPQVHLQLGQMLKEVEREEEAVEQLKAASEWAQGFNRQNSSIHMGIQQLFTEMERPELADKEQQWLDEYREEMSAQQPAPMQLGGGAAGDAGEDGGAE